MRKDGNMEELEVFLTENGPFFLATIDGDVPRVRPFGFAKVFKGKLTFATSGGGNTYNQLKLNPRFEVSCASKDYTWVRIEATARLIDDEDEVKELIEANPNIARLAGGGSGIGVYSAEDAVATFYSFSEAPRTVKL
jgi:uncharacterized pyridoxamine 5'-phosphate oxidase family protein